MEALREVLGKYGLEADLGAVWAMGVREGDVAWLVMTAEEMLENGLTGSAEQYAQMQHEGPQLGPPSWGPSTNIQNVIKLVAISKNRWRARNQPFGSNRLLPIIIDTNERKNHTDTIDSKVHSRKNCCTKQLCLLEHTRIAHSRFAS